MLTPEGSINLLDTFRKQIANLLSLVQQFMGPSVESLLDVDRCRDLMVCAAVTVGIPARFEMLFHKAEAFDLFQFQRYAELVLCLCCSRPSIPIGDLRGFPEHSLIQERSWH